MLKKRSLLPLLLSLLLVVSLVGCSSSSKETSSKKTATTKIEKTVSDQAKTTGASQSKTGPGALGSGSAAPVMKNGAGPGTADGTRIMGQIVSVKDRTVTLALFKMPSAPAAPSGNSTSPSAPPAGGTPRSGRNQPGGQTPQLSGEKKTITIPAAVKIYSGGRDSSTEVRISNLKAGQMMEARLNSSTNAVEAVRVMEEGQGGPPARGNAPGQNGNTSAN